MVPQDLTNPRIADLIRQAESSREMLLSEVKVLRHRLDVPSRIKGSLGEHPGAWMLGTAGVGLLASLLLRRSPSREERKSRGILSILLGLALTAARPLVKSWLTGQLGGWMARISSGPTVTHPDPTSRNFL
jgi:hypothetical protein